jgi:Domain of unknown function (DU1801)
MAKSENKTKPNAIGVSDFIETVADGGQRDDARMILAIMQRVTDEVPVMWGPSIVGFGSYHYRYASGHEGNSCRIGFSPRKGQTVLYLGLGEGLDPDLLLQLGKHKMGKGCLYIKKLADVDQAVLAEICSRSWVRSLETHPA